jgi:hypothetical protein
MANSLCLRYHFMYSENGLLIAFPPFFYAISESFTMQYILGGEMLQQQSIERVVTRGVGETGWGLERKRRERERGARSFESWGRERVVYFAITTAAAVVAINIVVADRAGGRAG